MTYFRVRVFFIIICFYNLDMGFKPSDCGDLKKKKYKSGVYTVYPDRSSGFYVYCNMRSYGGGWTVCIIDINSSARSQITF